MNANQIKVYLMAPALLGVCLTGTAQVSQNAQTASRSAALIDPTMLGEDSIIHFAGYFDTGYAMPEGNSDDLFTAKYAPIVHYQYQDWLFFEAEGEFGYEDNGTVEKESGLEYANLNFIVNDNLAIGVGKYLSPVGQFVQNLHPSWINKLPSAPIGFMGGHGSIGATPNADFGVQARGGFQTGENSRLNYALFAGNGPELVVEELEDGDLIIEGLNFPAKIEDENSDKALGGRFGFLPIPNLEIGVSFETASAAFAGVKEADEHGEEEEGDDHGEEEEDDHGEEGGGSLVRDRDFDVWGVDFYYAPSAIKNLTLRGEFASTKLSAGRPDEYDRSQKRWEAWYTQASYFFADRKLEAVTRYGNFQSNGQPKSKQWALGLNYLLKSNSIIKAAYEFNDSDGDDTLLFQYAYGF